MYEQLPRGYMYAEAVSEIEACCPTFHSAPPKIKSPPFTQTLHHYSTCLRDNEGNSLSPEPFLFRSLND